MREGVQRWPVMIQADDRERGAGVGEGLAADLRVRLTWKRLALGDYVLGNRIVVERKTVLDFAISVVDGRLFSQCSRLAECGMGMALLLEGTQRMLAGREFSRASLLGAMVTVQMVFGIPVLRSVSPEESASLLIIMAGQAARVEAGLIRRAGYRPRTKHGRQRFLLQGLPGTGPVLARRLLQHFGSVEGVMTASQDELSRVEGVGPGRAAAIREAVREHGVTYGGVVLTYHDNMI